MKQYKLAKLRHLVSVYLFRVSLICVGVVCVGVWAIKALNNRGIVESELVQSKAQLEEVVLIEAPLQRRTQFLAHLAHKIWLNETGGDDEKLLWWNEGEAFPSLGIGHFIWFPKGVDAPFEESFPKLLMFLYENNVDLPEWLEKGVKEGVLFDAPWPNKMAFLQAQESTKFEDLMSLMRSTKVLQAEFIAARFDASKQDILAAAGGSRSLIEARIDRLALSPEGQFALIDYLNFKGEGLNPKERYQNEAWGLLQVLIEMKESDSTREPIEHFIQAAKTILARRVTLSPPEKDEARWLPGWNARLDAYRK